MKFNYEYRTRDNVRHTGVISASSRENAFQQLKAQGIKPGSVTPAPGLVNKISGLGKRGLAIGILAVACIVLLVIVKTVGSDLAAAREEAKEVAFTFENTIRRQLIGDAAIIEKGIRTGWEDVFPDEGERFLASFAVPGVPAGLRNTSEDEIRKALDRRVLPLDGDSLETRQIKSIVEGMKEELRRFIAGGRHTIVEYGRRLVSRQEQEISYYQRAKTEIEAAKKRGVPHRELMDLWEKRNNQLRRIGVKLVPLPED